MYHKIQGFIIGIISLITLAIGIWFSYIFSIELKESSNLILLSSWQKFCLIFNLPFAGILSFVFAFCKYKETGTKTSKS